MSSSSPSAVSVVSLPSLMAARRTVAQRDAYRRLRWRERLTSLWAPVLIVAAALFPYMTLIAYVPSTASWAQPVMKGLGLLMVTYYVVLWVRRGVRSAWFQARRAAREQLEESERALSRAQAKQALAAGTGELVAEQALKVEAASVRGDADVLHGEVKLLSALTERHLGAFRKESSVELLGGVAKLLLIALVFRTACVEPYRIPSGSMLPTLHIGDFVLINKFIYGVRVPFANVVPFVILRPPARGDVVVFNNPVDTSADYIKRVVGVPGDTVELFDGVVHLNGQPQARQLEDPEYVVHDLAEGTWMARREALYQEDLGGVSHAVLQTPTRTPRHEGPYVVPEGHVFVMGDNRDNSADSRHGLGVTGYGRTEFVPYGHIKGKALVMWLSVSHGGLLHGLFGGTGLRVDRFFEPVR
ncbi:signal peptidase I [Myxococcus sp. K38C18041901]|uniref:signal peptidase I n=1 Tax=Myxococcus guangdongensis TaxID=2906760 RepID=UPI0020A7413F|nr:signal peptidase I [Myxococcus guangdongensis]MCP3060262.1 signal peptidase I [Myxococcus guangdongensis]